MGGLSDSSLCVILERSEESRIRNQDAKTVEQQELLRLYNEQSVANVIHLSNE